MHLTPSAVLVQKSYQAWLGKLPGKQVCLLPHPYFFLSGRYSLWNFSGHDASLLPPGVPSVRKLKLSWSMDSNGKRNKPGLSSLL